MKNFKLGRRSILHILLFQAAALLLCGTAFAQVSGFVVVNPIVVCDGNGANCPVFGVQCATNTNGAYVCTPFNTPSTATVNTPIGFVDGDNNINLTRAIMAAQAGIDVAFFPVQQYNSPTNADPWSTITPKYSSTTYQHLHLVNVNCKSGTVQASPDLAALTQHQICTEFGGVKTIANPPAPPFPPPPLASKLGESNALDVFFVTDFSGQAVFGNSWINGDGVSINSTATFTSNPSGPGPRFDVLAHEIGHSLALDHDTFGLGTGTNNNLMTIGSSRIVPSTSGCSTPNPYGTNNYQNPSGGVLYDLGDPAVYPSPVPQFYGTFKSGCPSTPATATTAPGLVDQLNSGSACTTLSTCLNQMGALALSPFINKTLASTASAGGGAPAAAVAGAATSSLPSNVVPFEVDATAGTGGNGDSINSIIIALPNISGLTFNGSRPATQTSSGGVNIISQVRLNGNNGIGNPNCVKAIDLSPPSVQCLQIFFSTGGPQGGGSAFTNGASVTFNLALNKNPGPNLVGTQFTTITSTVNTSAAFATTTTLGPQQPNGVFLADSRFPDLTIPNQINPNFKNAAVVQLGPDLSKCTPPFFGSGPHQQCPGGSLPVGPD